MTRKYIDFEVIKESWNKYSLQDGTKMKARVMLESVWVDEVDGKVEHHASTYTRHVWLCDPTVQGEPDNRQYTPNEMDKNIEVKHCHYTTLQYEPSEYELDNGTRIILHHPLVNIARTSLHNIIGDRIYIVTASEQMNVTQTQN